MMKNSHLTIFYDGYCPLCSIEMNKLKQLDKQQNIAFVDIQEPSFSADYPHLDRQELDARIHGYLADGSLISGLDVTYLAWKLVGKGWVYAPLRWPVIKWFADIAYNVFAKHRHRISYFLTGKKRCIPCENKGGKVDV
ncbi:MAG: putative DCC family thiol-disulfide oxidoreductase YuxK [Flavobacteriales bacterium]|jgi:predicted DCC family thiol-disulfide oxidoreductase YuxK